MAVEPLPHRRSEIHAATSHAPSARPVLTICPQCDLAQDLPPLAPGARALCARCRGELASGVSARLDLALAALATALILLVIMNAFPLVRMRVQDTDRTTTVLGAIVELQARGMHVVALLVLATTVIGPLVEVLFMAAVLVPIRVHHFERAGARLIGWIQRVRPWSMVEVFMLGVLVAVVKLAALAEIVPGPALWACAALIVTMSLLRAIVRPEDLWGWARLGAEAAP
jgi:paraquat-inducible protein A